jgi:hypothetical protein
LERAGASAVVDSVNDLPGLLDGTTDPPEPAEGSD